MSEKLKYSVADTNKDLGIGACASQAHVLSVHMLLISPS